MERKKILWLCSWYPDKNEPFNGDFVQRHARAAALYNDIYVIHLATDKNREAEAVPGLYPPTPGLTENIVYISETQGLFRRWRNYIRWNKTYKKTIKEFIKKKGKPELVHVHVPMRDGLMAMWLKRVFNIPYVVTEHWTVYQPQNEIKYGEQHSFLRSLIYWIVRKSSLLLPVSNDLGVLINKLVTPKEFRVVENAANTDLFYFKEVSHREKGFRFLHVSTFSFQKNAEGIIESFKLLAKKNQDASLVLVGPLTLALNELINQSGLLGKQIFLRGEISYPAVAAEMQEADALVLFSRYENSPCTIIEGLCCGLPVIATGVGGIPELIDASNGLLVDPMDKNGLTAAMDQMITQYRSFDRAAISVKAVSRFSYPVIGKKLNEVYSGLINKEN